ncbi:MAG TPA: ion channel [Nocardioidaceae bacterium]|nr:ion channel [Nocardioidaceae bacterium]
MRVVRFVRETPSALLLIVQLAGVLLYPFMESSDVGRAVFAMFGILVLILAVLAIRATPFLSWVSLLVAVPAVVLLGTQVFTARDELFPWSSGFEAVLYFYAAMSMLAYMLEDTHVDTDELFAIGAVFTLLAWAFAYVFVVLQAVQPQSFGAGATGTRSWMELLFLSFTTLSSTGLSDITPVTGHARSVVMLEQVAGIFYIAMVVTRLVSLKVSRTRG